MKKQMKKLLYLILVLVSFGLSAQSTDASFNYHLGNYSKDDLKDYPGAIEYYTKAIELDPNFGRAYLNRGISKSKLKDYSGAIADYTKAIEIDPNDALAYFNRGLSKYYLDDRFGACKDVRKAQELGYDDSVLMSHACN
jgi:tetratricopeptide (TPR) repeat protein